MFFPVTSQPKLTTITIMSANESLKSCITIFTPNMLALHLKNEIRARMYTLSSTLPGKNSI